MRLGVRDHVRHNRKTWDAASEEYQAAHDDDLTRRPLAWGAYRIPESELQVLGDVTGNDVLELGCGGAQWSTALAEIGSQCVALDLSGSQLHHARGRSPKLPLVQANGEQLPFADASFDVVFCDHGAISFCNPELIIPEAARTLRAAGALAFCTSTPLLYLTWDAKREKQSRRLRRSYDVLGRMELDEDTIDWVLPPGAWIRLLRANGFEVEDLIELRPPPGATTTYEGFAPPKWARRWPAEWIWKARRTPR
jgi:ubiquinone/menaquinone biosynthesis C-methylase UbiE